MDAFPISPASSRSLWFVALVCGLLLLGLLALIYTTYTSRHSRVELRSEGIRLVGDFWGREIPRASLDVAGARVIDLSTAPEYSPARRTLGTGVPGYSSGWFRLRNGEKALLYLTDRHNVVYVPTFDGYSLLLSVEEPRRFVEALKQGDG